MVRTKQKGLGERFISEVRKKIEEIAAAPKIYSIKGSRNYREAKVDHFPFQIIFKVYKLKKEIFINSIHHEGNIPKRNTGGRETH